jgi:hypothetical protein
MLEGAVREAKKLLKMQTETLTKSNKKAGKRLHA